MSFWGHSLIQVECHKNRILLGARASVLFNVDYWTLCTRNKPLLYQQVPYTGCFLGLYYNCQVNQKRMLTSRFQRHSFVFAKMPNLMRWPRYWLMQNLVLIRSKSCLLKLLKQRNLLLETRKSINGERPSHSYQTNIWCDAKTLSEVQNSAAAPNQHHHYRCQKTVLYWADSVEHLLPSRH